MQLFLAKDHIHPIDSHITDLVSTNYRGQKLLVILVGDNPSSLKYLSIKEKLCQQFGIVFDLHRFSVDRPDNDIANEVVELFKDPGVGGGIIQLPMPRESLNSLLELIPVAKDIDVLSSRARASKKESPIIKSVLYFLEHTKPQSEINDVTISIVGDGFLVGLPIYDYFKNKVRNIELITDYQKGMSIKSDLVILGTGVPELVSAADLSAGMSVIDFGSYVKEGKIVGDLNMSTDLKHLGFVAPSPGGMGPIVTRMLLVNFLENLGQDVFC